MEEVYVEQYEIPLPASDLAAIETTIREHDVFCSIVPQVDHADCLTWRRQTAHYGTQLCALFDRNILSGVLSVIRPAYCGSTEQCGARGRFGAALIAFLQVSNVVIEPSTALYERAETAPDELRLFLRADKIDPIIYTDIALGRRSFLTPMLYPKCAVRFRLWTSTSHNWPKEVLHLCPKDC
jgi:hypothetical protein